MSADKQLKAYIDRVLRLKEEQDTLGDDIREVYAEAKAEGYDKTIMGKLVAHLRKVQKSGEDAVSEQEMNFDTYLQAYHRASGTAVATHTHEEEFDAETGEVRDTKSLHQAAEAVSERTAFQVEDHSSAEATIEGQHSVTVATSAESAGEAVGIASDLPTNSPETAEFHAKASDDACEAGRKALGRAEASADAPDGAELVSRVVDGRTSTATSERMDETAGETAPLSPIAPASQGEAEAPSVKSVSPETHGSSDANTGGDHVDLNENAAPKQAVPGLVSTPRTATPGEITIEHTPAVPMHRFEYAHCFPELTKAQYEALEADIIASPCGVEEPIVRKGNVILDGFCRFNIARSLGEEYPVIEYDGSDELLDVIRWQRSSRDWTPQQEAKIAKALAAEVPARAEEIFAAFHIVPMREEEVA